MEIPKYLQQPHEPPTEIQQRLWDLEDEYVKRYGEIDWDESGFGQTDEEMIEALEICIKEGKRMKEVRPAWCEELLPWMWT